ncbi:MAG TPA: hypothetical protein VHO69_11140, partial [Phototrophicaceae bacterium]|nr:hypothetical protein [Phototrophicaceae bacterium]
WRLQVAQDELIRLNEAGVPGGAQQRADGLVWLSGDVIVHSESNYGLQRIPQTYDQAAWHPTCFTQDCPAVLALANGSTITVLGYPQTSAEDIQ